MAKTSGPLLLGEWACLGILYSGPTHGFAVASRLGPSGDIGHVWSLSRPLTYHALDKLAERGYVHPVGEERGIAGGNRTILAATRRGRAQLREWLSRPVDHVRDLRSELLLKLVIAGICGIDVTSMLEKQRDHIQRVADGLTSRLAESDPTPDLVVLWRSESALSALRFLDKISAVNDPH